MRPPHGLAMYVKQSIEIGIVETISSNEFECLTVQLNPSQQSTTIIVVYKAPNCTLNNFKKHILSMAQFQTSEKLVIVGDFNYDLSRGQNESFLHFIKSVFPTTQYLNTSTTTRDFTKLDLCFTSFARASARMITCVWSYHHTLVSSLS